MTMNPIKWTAAAVVVRNPQGQVLLLRRGPGAPWMPGKWNLPGGGKDPGETTEQAAIREAHEEAGIDLSHLSPLTYLEMVTYEDGVAYFYLADMFEDQHKPTLNWENDKLEWVDPLELLRDGPAQWDLIPGLREVLSKLPETKP